VINSSGRGEERGRVRTNTDSMVSLGPVVLPVVSFDRVSVAELERVERGTCLLD